MTDLRLVYNAETMAFDLALDGTGLGVDDGLETAVIVSLFSDARVAAAELDPDERDGDRRGWCGDVVPRRAAGVPRPGRRLGSRLWTRRHRKQTAATLALIRGDVEDALAWMVEDGIATTIEAAAEYPRPGVLALRATIVRADGSRVTFSYERLWQAQAERPGALIHAV